MKHHVFLTSSVFVLFASQLLLAQQLDWSVVQALKDGQYIEVLGSTHVLCSFHQATDDFLVCWKNGRKLSIPRAGIRSVQPKEYDESRWLSLLVAAQVGSGLDAAGKPVEFGTLKLGIEPVTLDLGYHHSQSGSAFVPELSGLLPVFRFPGTKPGREGQFLRLYAGPGIGYQAGQASFGGYSAANLIATVLSDQWKGDVRPMIEVQRRFPFSSPLRGDTRISIGFIWAVCEHCGVE